MFRITGKDGELLSQSKENKDRLPLLFQHGYREWAGGWVGRGFIGKAMPLRLVDEGYDVWMGNNRGVFYSNKNDRDGEWSLEERWSFDWTDMGLYDMPAQIEKVIEVTGKPKITVIGYSAGAAQNVYGMAKKPDFFYQNVNRFIGVGPCLISYPSDYPYPADALYWKDQYDQGNYFVSVADPFAKPAAPKIDCT